MRSTKTPQLDPSASTRRRARAREGAARSFPLFFVGGACALVWLAWLWDSAPTSASPAAAADATTAARPDTSSAPVMREVEQAEPARALPAKLAQVAGVASASSGSREADSELVDERERAFHAETPDAERSAQLQRIVKQLVASDAEGASASLEVECRQTVCRVTGDANPRTQKLLALAASVSSQPVVTRAESIGGQERVSSYVTMPGFASSAAPSAEVVVAKPDEQDLARAAALLGQAVGTSPELPSEPPPSDELPPPNELEPQIDPQIDSESFHE